MMTDRELLERAASAAGLKIDKSPYNGGGAGSTGFDIAGNAVLDWHNGTTWNPLVDDGDALRLAVALGMELSLTPNHGKWARITGYPRVDVSGHPEQDPCAATRRAIVRAAAELTIKKAPAGEDRGQWGEETTTKNEPSV